MRASELLLIVRAQNQASAALRRVAGDLRGLSTVGGLQRRGEQLNINRQMLQGQRQRIKNELESITNGQRALALQKAQAGAVLAESRARLTAAGVAQRQRNIEANQLRKTAEIGRLQRGLPTAGPIRADQLRLIEAAKIELATLNREEELLAERAGVAAGAISKQALSMKELEAREASLIARQAELNTSMATVGGRLRLNANDIRENNRAISAARWDRMAAGGRIMQHTARIMEYGGLVLGGVLAVTANNAAKFETSVTLAATQTRKLGQSFTATQGNAKVLQRDIRTLMTQFPGQAEDFSKAAYDIYSSTNVGFGRGRQLLKLFAQGAVAGMTDVQTATSAGITVLNNFNKESRNMPKLMQIMFAAVRFGRMTFKDFADSMATLAPAARAANQTFTSMAGSFAFLTRHLGVAKARVGYARVLEALTQPKMITGLKKVGIEVQDASHHMLPLEDIMGKIVARFPQLQRGGVDAMNFFKNIGGLSSTIMARRAFTFLVQFYNKAGKDGASYRQMLRQTSRDHNEFTRSLQAMEKTTGVRWGVFVNQLKALALAFGADVIPALLKLSGPIQDVVKWWENLSDATRSTIARFATYTAAFLLVGGAITFLAGTFMNLFATLGKFIGFGGTMTAALVGVAIAVTALNGDLHGLSNILDTIANFAFGSFQGFAISMGIAAMGANKLVGALRGVAAAEGAAAGGGILSSLLGRGRGAVAGARAATGIRASLMGAVAGAGLLSGSLLPVAGIVAAIGGGLLLWKLHMREAAKEAEFLKKNIAMAAAPRQQIDLFQQMGLGVEAVERAKINMRTVARSIADTRKQLVGARGAQRLALLDQLKSQTMDLMDAQNAYTDSVARSNKQFDAYTVSFQKLGYAGRQVNTLRNQLGDLLRLQARAPMTPGIADQITRLRANIRAMIGEMAPMARNLQTAFDGVVKSIAKIEGIKLPRGALQDMFQTSLKMGRMLTIPEIRAVVRAEVDPAARRRIPGQIGAIFRGVRAQRIKIEVDQAAQRKATNAVKQAQKAVPKAFKFPAFSFPDPKAAAKKAHSSAAKVFTPINQKVNVKIPGPGQLVKMGADITSGIQAGIDSVDVTIVKHMTTITKEIQAKSPSLWAINKVGKPIGQGIALGILRERGEIEKAATASITFFESAAIQKAQEAKKKITNALLIGDIGLQAKTLTQFNNAIAKLGRRKVPRELIDALAELGPDQAKFISQIANMSEKELRRYVRAWLRANAQVKRSMRETTADLLAANKQMHDNMMSTLTSTFNSIRDQNVSNFGALFEGPTNLASKVGEGFQQAMDEYNSSAADFRSQIADLNNQIADAQKEAQQRLIDAINQRRDELQSAMGDLFSGDWMQGTVVQTKIEWGKKLGFDDLQKDLESQVNKFQHWRELLTALAAKVPPELAAQLEKLGPEAVDKLDVLNSGTNEQIAQYVATWQQGQAAINAVASKTTVDTSDITARVNDILGQIDEVTKKLGALQMPHPLTGQDIINDLKAQEDQWVEYSGLLQSLHNKGIPDLLLQQLQQMGPKAIPYLQALNNMSKPQLEEFKDLFVKTQESITTTTIDMMNTQLDLWFQYGKRAGFSFIQGFEATSPQLQAYFTDLITQLITQGKIVIPRTNPIGTTGNEKSPVHITGGSDTGSNLAADTWQTRTVGEQTTNYNLTVNQAQGEDLSTTLERATFRLANRTQ